MSKKLIAIMVLALVVGISAAAYAEVQNVKIGGDFTAVGVSRDNWNFKSESNAGKVDAAAWASIARIKIDANLTDNVDVAFRLLNERILSTTAAAGASQPTVDVDLAYMTLKEFMKDTIGVPLTLVLGRQNIKIGSGLLIGAPGANQTNGISNLPVQVRDLSSRAAFDAMVGVWEWTPEFTMTTGFVKVTEGDILNNKDDVNVFVVDAGYKFGEDSKNTSGALTYVAQSATDKGSIYNYGVRASSMPFENIGVEGEYVYQTAKRCSDGTLFTTDGKSKNSDAFRVAASLGMPDVTWTPSVGLDYARLSKNWNPMHESWTPASITNTLFPNSDIKCIGANVSAKPMSDLMLKARFVNLTLAKKYDDVTFTSAGTGLVYNTIVDKKAAGYEYDLGAVYDYTSDVQFGLNYGFFKPGKVFVDRKAASEVIGSMKVTF